MFGEVKAAIAVTGDIGAGKSTVSGILVSLGGVLVDADAIVASLWKKPEIIGEAVNHWGPSVLDPDGNIERSRIGSRIFTSRLEYEWCSALLHPYIISEMERRAKLAAASDNWVVSEIPLLYEFGFPDDMCPVIYVTADWDVRVNRCLIRRWNEDELRRRESFLLPQEERKSRADYIIENNGTLEELRVAVEEIYRAVILKGE